MLAIAAVCSLGAELSVGGRRSVSLPWSLLGGLPLFDNVLPARLAMYISLLTAVIVALWAAARPRGLLYWLLPAVAALTIVPNLDPSRWSLRFSVPPFFSDRAYRSCLEPNENVLALPVTGDGQSMLWQADADYRFRMAGGYISPNPPGPFLAPEWVRLVAEDYPVPASQRGELTFFIRAKEVTSVVVDPQRRAMRWTAALDRIAAPHRVGGVILYHVSGERRSRSCPTT